MLQRELHELPHRRQVRAGAADGVVAGIGQVVRVVPVYRLAVALQQGVVHDDTGAVAVDLDRIDLDALELHQTRRAVDRERVPAVERAELPPEVRLEVPLEQLLLELLGVDVREAGELDRVGVGQDQRRLAELDVRRRRDGDGVPGAHARVLHGVLRQADRPPAPLVARVHLPRTQRARVAVHDHGDGRHRLPPALPLDRHRVPVEQAQVLHGRLGHGHDGVAVGAVVEEGGHGRPGWEGHRRRRLVAARRGLFRASLFLGRGIRVRLRGGLRRSLCGRRRRRCFLLLLLGLLGRLFG